MACRSPTRTCITCRASSPSAARKSARAGSRPQPRRRSRGSKRRARCGSARCNMVEFAYRPDRAQSAHRPCAQSLESRAHHRRLVVRLGFGGRGAARPGRARLRYRRLDPHAGAFLRRHRVEADQRPRQPRQRDAALVHARHRRPARPHGGRLRPDHGSDRRSRSARPDHGRRAGLGREGRAAKSPRE